MKNKHFQKNLLFLALIVLLAISSRSAGAAQAGTLPAFSDFVVAVTNGQGKVVRGVYVPEILALPVLQQPEDDPETVFQVAGVVTQLRSAARNNVIGLLAHNYLAGASFSNLKVGQNVRIVYGNGQVNYYKINRLARFRAILPGSQEESYVDLISDISYTAQDIFTMFYDGDDHVTFQTCIRQGDNSSWGRLFVTAIPVSSVYLQELWTLTLQEMNEFSKMGDRLGQFVGGQVFR